MMRQLAVRNITILLALLSSARFVYATGSVTGQGRFECIAGVPSMGYKYLYEWDLFLSPSDNSMVGPCRRLGAPPGQMPTGDGYYRIDNLPAGTYSIYVNQPDFFASPKVVPNVEIVDNQQATVNVDLDVDYSTYFKDTGGGQWTDWQETWYQTFLATGTSVRAVSWIMAGWGQYGDDWAEISILEDNGNADVRNWTVIGSKTKESIGADTDLWLRWPSGQVPLTAGKKYAIKIWVHDGCAIYKRDRDNNSYPHGRAYDLNGNVRNFDLNITVFVDRNNQIVTHTRLNPGPGHFNGDLSDVRWGQTFVATGTSLAAADLFAASTDENFDVTWRIREGGTSGTQIGPTKTTQGAYFASSTDLLGVSYNPGDVPLASGQTYCIEILDTMNFTPYVQEAGNSYADGRAYRNGAATDYDLAMTIMEYTETEEPMVTDFDGDKWVNLDDFSILGLAWRSKFRSPGWNPDCDVSDPADNKIDGKDLAVVVGDWLEGTSAPVPAPGQAGNPYPADGATRVGTGADLSWTAGAFAESHEVYFGTSSPGTFQGNQTATTFDPGAMASNTTYYWRVDEVNGSGKTTGTVWSFTTYSRPTGG